MMKSNEYLKTFDFKEYLKSYKKIILEKSLIKDYIEEKGYENLRFFSEMFWDDTEYGVKELKEELNIPNNIGYIDILHLFPNDMYIELLNDIYMNKLSNQKIAKKYNLVKSKISDFMLNPICIVEEQYCPYCLKNQYEIDLSQEDVIYKCSSCHKRYSEEKFLSKNQVEKIRLEYQRKKVEFEAEINSISEDISQIKCPKCQKNLSLVYDDKNFIYEIRCTACKYCSNDYAATLRDYTLWQRRAAMMIAIRAKEEEMISKTLKTKEIEKSKFIHEEIITSVCMMSTIERGVGNNIWNENDIQTFEKFKPILKKCNRLEKNLLIELIKIGQVKGNRVEVWQSLFIQIKFENPLISEIIEITFLILSSLVLSM